MFYLFFQKCIVYFYGPPGGTRPHNAEQQACAMWHVSCRPSWLKDATKKQHRIFHLPSWRFYFHLGQIYMHILFTHGHKLKPACLESLGWLEVAKGCDWLNHRSFVVFLGETFTFFLNYEYVDSKLASGWTQLFFGDSMKSFRRWLLS